MADFEDAKLAIEYRPEIKSLSQKIKNLPKKFQTRFYELLSEQPKIDADKLETLIRSEYEKWLNPYDSNELNNALNEIRSLGPEAEHDFREVIEKLDTSVNTQKVVSIIKEKYAHSNSMATKFEGAQGKSNHTKAPFRSDAAQSSEYSTTQVDVLEPTESNLPNDNDGWIFGHVVPWRRYIARMFDITFNGVILWMLIGVVAYQIIPYEADYFFTNLNPIFDVIATSFLGCLSTGVLVGFTGTTIGKWIFGIRVLRDDGKTIGITDGIIRDLKVWVKGLAFGIPIFSLVTLYTSYNGLKRHETTSWDSGRYALLYRPSGPVQYTLNVIGIIILLVLSVIVRVLSEM